MDRKEYQRLYYLKNKAKKQEQYYKNHEHFLQYKKDYLKTEIGYKSCKIKNWKAYGIKLKDGTKAIKNELSPAYHSYNVLW